MTDFNRRKFLKTAGIATASALTGNVLAHSVAPVSPSQGASIIGLVTPKMDIVRVGFIGVGQRGIGHVKHFVTLMVWQSQPYAIPMIKCLIARSLQ